MAHSFCDFIIDIPSSTPKILYCPSKYLTAPYPALIVIGPLCFINFAKAFDNTKHENLLEMVEDIQANGKDIRIIRNTSGSKQQL